jgi:hypothetical protein
VQAVSKTPIYTWRADSRIVLERPILARLLIQLWESEIEGKAVPELAAGDRQKGSEPELLSNNPVSIFDSSNSVTHMNRLFYNSDKAILSILVPRVRHFDTPSNMS